MAVLMGELCSFSVVFLSFLSSFPLLYSADKDTNATSIQPAAIATHVTKSREEERKRKALARAILMSI